ncbi:unnamed protein product [Cochlearia groenlandica]
MLAGEFQRSPDRWVEAAGSSRSGLKMTNAAVSTAIQDCRRRCNEDYSRTFFPAVTRPLDQTSRLRGWMMASDG